MVVNSPSDQEIRKVSLEGENFKKRIDIMDKKRKVA